MPGTWLWSPPTPCCPHRTRSKGARVLIAAASARAVPRVSAASRAASFTWTAESAPIASPVRRAAWARSGPAVTRTTSPPLFSLIRSASSIANSS